MKREQQNIFTESLLKWFGQNARVLPWREDPAPYRVWISEIMLQQTRVAAVMPYFNRFLAALPKVENLAVVPDDKLLKLWEGLGYYNRARNLKKAAQIIMSKYNGVIPEDYNELLKLPGIGPYTAGAIASIAYGKDKTAVDGNVLRVFSRVNAEEGDITSENIKKKIEEIAIECLPISNAGCYNQSLMELGATVCLPNGEPKCHECPVREVCEAYKLNKMTEYPKKSPKKKRSIEEKTILILQDSNYLAIRKRPDHGLLAGLYEFPSMEGYHSETEVLEYVKKMGFQPLHVKKLVESKHIFTHKEWHMTGYAIRVDELTEHTQAEQEYALLFVEPQRTETDYPIPAAYAAYADAYHIRLGNSRFE